MLFPLDTLETNVSSIDKHLCNINIIFNKEIYMQIIKDTNDGKSFLLDSPIVQLKNRTLLSCPIKKGDFLI